MKQLLLLAISFINHGGTLPTKSLGRFLNWLRVPWALNVGVPEQCQQFSSTDTFQNNPLRTQRKIIQRSLVDTLICSKIEKIFVECCETFSMLNTLTFSMKLSQKTHLSEGQTWKMCPVVPQSGEKDVP